MATLSIMGQACFTPQQVQTPHLRFGVTGWLRLVGKKRLWQRPGLMHRQLRNGASHD
jgi:hypothetical protein